MITSQPESRPTVIPRLFTADTPGLIAFLKIVFNAGGDYLAGRPAEMRIGDSIVMVSDGGGVREETSSCLYVYVQDTDATYGRAIAARAQSIEAPLDTHYGDRRATVRDSWGNIWQIATRK